MKISCDFLNITVSKTKIFKIPCFVHLSTPQIKNKDEFDLGLILTALQSMPVSMNQSEALRTLIMVQYIPFDLHRAVRNTQLRYLRGLITIN